MVAAVIPVGQFCGRFDDPGSEEGEAHLVRLGPDLIELRGAAFEVWLAAWGDDESLDATGYVTRRALEAIARDRGVDDLAGPYEELVRQGLLLQVVPTENELARFARAHRVVPTAMALGVADDEPELMMLGLPDDPRVGVSFGPYQVWCFSAQYPSLWDACEGVSQTLLADNPQFTATTLLSLVFECLPTMIGVNCAYLDRRL